ELQDFGYRQALRVPEIELQLPSHIVLARVVFLVHLRRTADPRKPTLPLLVANDPLAQLEEEVRLLGTRSHDVHLATNHVDQLRQLSQTELAENSADGGDPRIILLRPDLLRLRRCHVHRAELVDRDQLATVLDPTPEVSARRRPPIHSHARL